jgi:hypothetical protein
VIHAIDVAGGSESAQLFDGNARPEADLEAARLAFAQAFEVTAVLTAAIALVTAAMVVFVLREDAAEVVRPDAGAERTWTAEPRLATAPAGCD